MATAQVNSNNNPYQEALDQAEQELREVEHKIAVNNKKASSLRVTVDVLKDQLGIKRDNVMDFKSKKIKKKEERKNK